MATTWTNNTKNTSTFSNDTKHGVDVETTELIDSYSEISAIIYSSLYTNYIYGQSFLCTKNCVLDSAKFFLGSKTGSPIGNSYVKLWNMTGTFGTSSKPTGTVLAVSDPVDASLISQNSLNTLTFSGSNRINLIAGNYYVINFDSKIGDVSNHFHIGYDATGSGHGGNGSYSSNEITWTATSNRDYLFYLYGVVTTSGTDFTNGTKNTCVFTNQTKN